LFYCWKIKAYKEKVEDKEKDSVIFRKHQIPISNDQTRKIRKYWFYALELEI